MAKAASHKAAAQTRARDHAPVPVAPPRSEGRTGAPAKGKGAGFRMTSASNGKTTFNAPPKGTAGGSFQMTGASDGKTTFNVARAGAAAAPRAPSAAPDPFLTPDQQGALTRWNTTYRDDLANLDQADKNAAATYTQDLGNAQLKNAQNVDMTNQSMAARGMFQSSIRDNALNDLAVTMTQQTNLLGAARDATLFKDQTQRTALSGDNSATQTQYSGDAIANAQAITPPTQPATPAPSPNQITPTPPLAPTPVAAAHSEGITVHPNAAVAAPHKGTVGASFTMTGASNTRAARQRAGAGGASPSGGAGLRGI